jgi:anti-sigma factor RsiW
VSSSYTCQDCIDLLLDYVDGALDQELRSRLEAHLHDCQPCEDFLKTYSVTMPVCRKALAREMPESVSSKLHQFLRTEIGKDSVGH